MPVFTTGQDDEELAAYLRARAQQMGPQPRPEPANDFDRAVDDWTSGRTTNNRSTSSRNRSTSSRTSSSSYDPLSSAYRPPQRQTTYIPQTNYRPTVTVAPAPPPRSTYSVDPLAAAINRWQDSNQQTSTPRYDPLSSARTSQRNQRSINDIVLPDSGLDYSVGQRPDTGTTPIQGTNYRSQSIDPDLNVPWLLSTQFGPIRKAGLRPTEEVTEAGTTPMGPQYGSYAPTGPQTEEDTWGQRLEETLRSWQPNWLDRTTQAITRPLEKADTFFGQTIPEWYAQTPGAQYANELRGWRETHGASQGDQIDKPSLDRARDMLMSGVHGLTYVPGKAIETTPIPYSGTALNQMGLRNQGDVSLGQLAASAGQALNQVFNPLNPNNVLTGDENQNPFIEVGRIFSEALNQSRTARAKVEQMGPDASIALVNLTSGGDHTVKAASKVMGQDAQVARLIAQAEADGKAADALEAEGRFDEAAQLRVSSAQAGRQAYELRNKSKTQLIDEEMNVWAEVLSGILLDPFNAFDLSTSLRGMRAAREAAKFNLSEADALRILGSLDEEAPKIITWSDWLNQPLDEGVKYADALIGPQQKNWLSNVNPLARTADTQARLASDTLYRATAQLLTSVTNKETARQVLETWATNPQQLVTGITTKEGFYQVGGGILANPYVMEYYPFLQKMGQDIANIGALKGNGGFDPIEVLSTLEDTFYRGARQQLGIDNLPDLPAGTIRTRLRKTGANTAHLEYLGKGNKVVGKSEEMITVDAQQLQKNIRNAVRSAGPGGGNNKLAATWGLQKAILSDMYLGMSPGYWIKNALSATTHLLADDNFTLLPTKKILDDFHRWYGGAPTTRALDAEMGATGAAASDAMGGGLHWLERAIGSNPFSSMMNRLYQIPFGATDIAGRIPIGEQNFALRGTYVPVKRYITNGWDYATNRFTQALEQRGIQPDIARTLGGVARDAGINGNKQRITQDVKKAVTAQTFKASLSELGVPDELLSAQSWADLQDVFNSYAPDEIADAANEVRRIFAEEFKQPAEVLDSAPPQPSRTIFSTDEAVQDGAELVDDTVEAARRAGDNVEEVRQSSEAIAQQIAEAETTLWAKIRAEVAESTDPRAMNVALDLLGKWYDWRRDARRRVDELSKMAIREDTPQAWQRKWQGTQAIYGEFTGWFDNAVQEARHGLLTGEAEGYDWFKAIQRYVEYDDITAQANRADGATLGSPQDAQETYESVIAANRSFLDATYVELFSAFKRYASQESLDVLASGIRQVEQMGAQTAQAVAKQRAKLLADEISRNEFYKFRNKAWAQFFDNAAIYNKVQQRLIVARGVAESVASNLRWTDEFAGGEFQLIGRGADGFWEARHTGDDEIHRFADPTNTSAALPEVPQAIINDFNRAIGNIETTVDEVLEALSRGITPEEFEQYVDILAGMETRPTTTALDETEGLRAERAAAIQEGQRGARGDIRSEWDRVATAEGGYNSLDQTIAAYTRQGRVQLPERFGEELIGQTIAGQRINNTADIERLLQNYYDTGSAQRTARREAARPTQDADDMRDYDFLVPSFDLDNYLREQQAKRTNPYEIRNEEGDIDYFGMNEGGNLYNLIDSLNGKMRRLMGEKAPEMGDMASHTIRTLAEAEQRVLDNLEGILVGKPNTLTPRQQIEAIDELNRILPEWDNLLAAAAKIGEDAANFSMLNYSDRRNFDAMLGFLSTYHYYYSRTPKNWLKRVAQKPSILAHYYRMQRGIEAENEQQNLPQHLRGTIPNPLGFGPNRLGNPLTWLLPFAMVMGNEFVNPDEARSETERWYNNAQKYMPGFAPIIQAGMAAYLDSTAPLPDGRTRLGQLQLGDYLPLYRLGGYARQAATGDMGPGGFAAYGDEFDYGRAGKQVELQEVRGDIREGGAAWGVDVGAQRQRGLEPLPEQPEGAESWWEEGAQRAGLERLIGRGMSFLTGVPGYYLDDAERQMRDMKSTRVGLGYDAQENPYGSRTAVNEYTQQQGDAGFNYAKLYPGGENRERPGITAATSDYWDTVNPEFEKMNQASADFLTENPNASSRDLRDVKDPYFDNIKAIGEDFPSVTRKVGEGENANKPRNTRYMSPQERARYEVENLLGYEPPNKPEYPGEEAEPKALQQYYKDKATWDMRRLTQIDRNLNQLYSMETEAYPADWMPIARDLIGGEYSSELMRIDGLRNADPIEQAWSDRQSFVEEVTDAEYRNRAKNVTDRLGEEATALYEEYLATPKGEARDAFKEENPEVDLPLFAAFSAKEYDAFVKQFGEEALTPVFLDKKPSHPGDNASDAAMDSYYASLDAYNQKYPIAEEARLWVKGRRWGPNAPDDGNGRAWQEAKDIFGDDIFEIVSSFPSGGSSAEISAWYRNNGAKADLRSAYFAWRREHNEEDAARSGEYPDSIYPGNEGAGQGYEGPRPVGRDFVPVGENRWWEEQEPNRWATTDWGPIAEAQAENPWTQRANELNAALFGDVSIPSEMAGLVNEEGETYTPSDKTAAEYASSSGGRGRGYSRGYRRGYTPYRRYSRGGYRRYYGGGGGGAGGNYYVPQVDPREFSAWLMPDPERVAYQAPQNFAPRSPDLGPDAIRAWRPISWR